MTEPAAFPTLLHVDSSVSAARDSVTRQLTGRFAAVWRERLGERGHRHRDLAADPVPQVTAAYARLGYRAERHGTVPPARVAALCEDAEEEREWDRTRPLVEEVLAAGVLLLGVPMYNLTVPATLKAWIDRINFPGALTDPATGAAALREKQVVLVTAHGGGYGPGSPKEGLDFLTPYLRGYLTDRGLPEDRLHVVTAELTRAGDLPQPAPLRPLSSASAAQARAAVGALADRLTAGAAPYPA